MWTQEVGNLRSSLDQAAEVKERAQQQAVEEVRPCALLTPSVVPTTLCFPHSHVQWEKKLQELNAQVASEGEQRQTSEKMCQQVRM